MAGKTGNTTMPLTGLFLDFLAVFSIFTNGIALPVRHWGKLFTQELVWNDGVYEKELSPL